MSISLHNYGQWEYDRKAVTKWHPVASSLRRKPKLWTCPLVLWCLYGFKGLLWDINNHHKTLKREQKTFLWQGIIIRSWLAWNSVEQASLELKDSLLLCLLDLRRCIITLRQKTFLPLHSSPTLWIFWEIMRDISKPNTPLHPQVLERKTVQRSPCTRK